MTEASSEDVWTFWLGVLGADGTASGELMRQWWSKDPALDATIRARFLPLHELIMRGEREAWRHDPRAVVAYVVVLDQFSRNMFRDTPRMFASDGRALAAAKDAVARGLDVSAPSAARMFLYMPYMHSEALADQDECVRLFEAMALGGARVAQNVEFAEKHRAIIRRFGRFPHRNAILGRASTAEEVAFLAEPGSSF